jgi:branched-chain amino acid transport system permease protein
MAVSYFGSELETVPSLFSSADWRVGNLVVSLPQLAGLVCSVALISGLSLRPGRALRTIAEDSDTARLLGVDVGRVMPLVFVISGLFAAPLASSSPSTTARSIRSWAKRWD